MPATTMATRHRNRTRALLASLLLLAGCDSNRPMVGERAPAIQGAEWVRPAAARHLAATEPHWVVAAFLIPSCAVCRRDTATLVELRNELPEPVEIVGITSSNVADVRAFVESLDVNFPVLAGGKTTIDAFGVHSVPQVYLIAPDGTVVADGIDEARERLRRELGG